MGRKRRNKNKQGNFILGTMLVFGGLLYYFTDSIYISAVGLLIVGFIGGMALTRKIKRKKQKEIMLFTGMLLICAVPYFLTNNLIYSIGFILLIGSIRLFKYIPSQYNRRKKENDLRDSGIQDIDMMDGIQFEHYLSALFKGNGYKAQVTKSTGDFGADLILTRNHEKIVVQAKRYGKKVGISAIQQIVASKQHYKASEAWVVTNNFFTKQASELAESNAVTLIDRKGLIDYIVKINPSGVPSAKEIRETVTPKEVPCPVCDSKMVAREGFNGPFYGCSKFPSCTGTKAI